MHTVLNRAVFSVRLLRAGQPCALLILQCIIGGPLYSFPTAALVKPICFLPPLNISRLLRCALCCAGPAVLTAAGCRLSPSKLCARWLTTLPCQATARLCQSALRAVYISSRARLLLPLLLLLLHRGAGEAFCCTRSQHRARRGFKGTLGIQGTRGIRQVVVYPSQQRLLGYPLVHGLAGLPKPG